MEAFKKATSDSFTLRVVPVSETRPSYFLRSYSGAGLPNLWDFQWVKKEKVRASVTFAITSEGTATSLPQAPFGGIWIDESLDSESLDSFLVSLLEKLQKSHVSEIHLVQPPKPYMQEGDLVNYLLSKNGFRQKSMLSHQFFIGKKKIKKFVQKDQSKFSQKLKDTGLKLQSGSIQNFNFLQEIRTWNSSRGYEFSVNEERLIQQVSEFPERYFLISIMKEGKNIAHTLAVRLTSDSIYYYLSAIDPKTNLKNIGDLLLFSLFQLAAERKVEFVDLGSSELESGPNHSLMFFKSRFSNDISNKVFWTRNL